MADQWLRRSSDLLFKVLRVPQLRRLSSELPQDAGHLDSARITLLRPSLTPVSQHLGPVHLFGFMDTFSFMAHFYWPCQGGEMHPDVVIGEEKQADRRPVTLDVRGQRICVTQDHGVFLSLDNGQTWRVLVPGEWLPRDDCN